MTGKELLLELGNISLKYYQEAENETLNLQRKGAGKRRVLLVAAIIALSLLLIGCTIVCVLHLQDLKIGEYTFTKSRYIDADGNKVHETEMVREAISLQGIQGSPNFLASQEWFLFEQSYDSDHTLLNEADENPMDISSDYDAYFVYTQDMIDKIDEIAEKYNLRLAGEFFGVQDYEIDLFFDILGIRQLHQKNADIRYDSGYFYACGNFSMDFEILTEERSNPVFGNYRYIGKDFFDTVYSSVEDMDTCEQWVYTTSDGYEILIVTDENHAIAFCDREDAFITIHLNEAELTGKEAEEIFNCFDYSVHPQKPDIEDTRRKLEESYLSWQESQEAIMETWVNPFYRDYKSYEDVIRFILEGQVADSYYYALWDVTEDGVDELFIGRNGSFGTIKTMKEGKPDTLYSNGTDEGLVLCEGNILKYSNGEIFHHMKLDKSSGQFETFLELGYDVWEESWYYKTSDTGAMAYISEETYLEMQSDYGAIDIGLKPISQYPFS